ncbi:PKD domain-containing protein [Myxococcota bacterium]|nr:PKD domain-containing protein [Myxococcota bacterium]
MRMEYYSRPMLGLTIATGLALSTACGGVDATSDFGEVDIGVSAAALSAADVTRVAITVSGDGISPDIQRDLSYSGGQWRGLIGSIPAGPNRSFAAVAYDGSGANIYQGSVTGVTITRGGVATVAILLQQTTAPDPFLNDTPNINAVLVIPGALAPGDRAQVIVQASDPDAGDVLSYQWTATGGAFDDASVASTYFTAPMTEGTYALTIAVSDQKSAGRSVTVNVEVSSVRAVGKAFVIASFNTWPEVRGFAAAPSLVAPGASTALTITTFDSEGDTVSLAMSDGCGGTFTGSSFWTAPAVAPVSGRCTLSVVATDGRGGTGLGSLEVVVGTEISANLGPVIVDSYQSIPTLTVAGSVDFSVEAEDADGDALTFSWTAPAGTFGAVTTSGNVSSVTWTSPASISGEYFITVEVTDTAGNSTQEIFLVGVNPG